MATTCGQVHGRVARKIPSWTWFGWLTLPTAWLGSTDDEVVNFEIIPVGQRADRGSAMLVLQPSDGYVRHRAP